AAIRARAARVHASDLGAAAVRNPRGATARARGRCAVATAWRAPRRRAPERDEQTAGAARMAAGGGAQAAAWGSSDGVVGAATHAVALEVFVAHELTDVESQLATPDAGELFEILHRRLAELGDDRQEQLGRFVEAHAFFGVDLLAEGAEAGGAFAAVFTFFGLAFAHATLGDGLRGGLAGLHLGGFLALLLAALLFRACRLGDGLRLGLGALELAQTLRPE